MKPALQRQTTHRGSFLSNESVSSGATSNAKMPALQRKSSFNLRCSNHMALIFTLIQWDLNTHSRHRSALALKRTNSKDANKEHSLPGQVDAAPSAAAQDGSRGTGSALSPDPPRLLNWMGCLSVAPKDVAPAAVSAAGELEHAAHIAHPVYTQIFICIYLNTQLGTLDNLLESEMGKHFSEDKRLAFLQH
jgi:hypothetical protein